MRRRVLALCVISAVSLAGACGYVANAALDARRVEKRAEQVQGQAVPVAFQVAAVTSQKPYVVFRRTDATDPYTFGRLALAPLDDLAHAVVTKQKCARVAFSGGRGSCLDVPNGFGSSKRGWILGADLVPIRTFDIFGRPTRTRVSRDGKLAGVTVFDLGGAHSYAVAGTFATKTTLIDVASGKTIANLEQFKATRNGKPFKNVDFNFWGVTFANDHNVFYATLASGKKTYLVRGNIRKRTLTTVFENVECPALSPDETRVAFKRRTPDPGVWRFAVLDLKTKRVTLLSERQSVYDQPEWLDNRRVLYSRDNDVYVVNADGSGLPKVLIHGADSPTVVR